MINFKQEKDYTFSPFDEKTNPKEWIFLFVKTFKKTVLP